MRIGLLGYGNIGRMLVYRLRSGDLGDYEVVAAAGLPEDEPSRPELEELGVRFTTDPADLLTLELDLVVEAASQAAVRDWAESFLRSGISMVMLSVGALADNLFRARVEAAAAAGNAFVHIPSGAVGGVDALKAARMGSLRSVRLITTKPPGGLGGPDASVASVVFQGSAAEGARILPKNINVGTTLGMAGLGADQTRVEVVMDPHTLENTHRVEVEGDFGRLEMVVQNRPCPDNPRTSYLAVLSTFALLKGLQARIRVGT